MKNLIILIAIFISPSLAHAQVSISLHQPPPNKLSAGDLWRMTLENTTGSPLEIYLEGYGDEQKEGRIVDGRSPVFTLPPGSSNYNYESFKSGNVSWKSRNYEEFIVRTGTVPAGTYTTCVTAYSTEGIILGMEKCITQVISGGFEGEISLISPSDGEVIDLSLPLTFSWTPLPNAKEYTLKIWEINEGEFDEGIIVMRKPFFEKSDITTKIFLYPSPAPKFAEGKKYAWQVSSNILQSGIYSFTFPIKSIDKELQSSITLVEPKNFQVFKTDSDIEIDYKPNFKWNSKKDGNYKIKIYEIDIKEYLEIIEKTDELEIKKNELDSSEIKTFQINFEKYITHLNKTNKVFYELNQIKSNSFQYPEGSKKFDKNKSYAWQILSENIISEIYVFSIDSVSSVSSNIIFCTQPPSNMTGWWSFEENSGTTSNDISTGFNNFGTHVNFLHMGGNNFIHSNQVGLPISVNGKVGRALKFSGTNWVEVPSHSDINFGSSSFSIDAWIRTNENTNELRCILEKVSYGPVPNGYRLYIYQKKLFLSLINNNLNDAGNNYTAGLTPMLLDGNWHHIAVTVNRDEQRKIIFYIDGSPIATILNPTPSDITNNAALSIGIIQSNKSSGLKGEIDELEFFKRVLSPEEVYRIYSAGSYGKCRLNNQCGIFNNMVTKITVYPHPMWGFCGITIPLAPASDCITAKQSAQDFFLAIQQAPNCNAQCGSGCLTYIDPNIECIEESVQTAPGIYVTGWTVKIKWGCRQNENVGGSTGCECDGNSIYVGGQFLQAGGIPVSRIAKWDGNNWAALGSGLGGNSMIVKSIAVDGDDVFVGGVFSSAGGIPANNIAKWNAVTCTWSALGEGVDGRVSSIDIINNEVYVGGKFTTAGGQTVNNIALWDRSSLNWSSLQNGVTGYTFYDEDETIDRSHIEAIVINDNDVYAGGQFASAGSIDAGGIAKWDRLSHEWSSLGSFGFDEYDNYNEMIVSALAISDDYVYVGGGFRIDLGGGDEASNIARWNVISLNWYDLSPRIDNNSVTAIGILGDNVYVGGGTWRIDVWNKSTSIWSFLNGSNVFSEVYSIAIKDNENIYFGGYIHSTNSQFHLHHILKYNETTQQWNALGSGTTHSVNSIAVCND